MKIFGRVILALLFLTLLIVPLKITAQGQLMLTEDQAGQEALLAINHIKKSHPNP